MDLKTFDISEETGFCLEDPLTELPPDFREWHRIASTMPKLIEKGTVRQEVDRMPLLDAGQLKEHRQQCLGHLQLATIAAGYVWGCGDKNAAKAIPASLAIPLYTLSKALDLPPAMSHADRCLANWTLIDRNGPRTLENVHCLYPMLNAGDEGRFFTEVVIMVEQAFGPAIKPIVSILTAVDNDDVSAIPRHLDTIAQSLHDMHAVFARLHERMKLFTFLFDMIPYERGWGGEDNNPVPEGLIFRGVSNAPFKTSDDKGAQTPILQTVDALLGVHHSQESRVLLVKLRKMMLPGHRRFIESIEERPKRLRDLVEKSGNEELQEAYNRCLNAVITFRSKHFNMFAKYFVVASKRKAQESKDAGGHEVKNFTHLSDFLKECRKSASEKLLPSTST